MVVKHLKQNKGICGCYEVGLGLKNPQSLIRPIFYVFNCCGHVYLWLLFAEILNLLTDLICTFGCLLHV